MHARRRPAKKKLQIAHDKFGIPDFHDAVFDLNLNHLTVRKSDVELDALIGFTGHGRDLHPKFTVTNRLGGIVRGRRRRQPP